MKSKKIDIEKELKIFFVKVKKEAKRFFEVVKKFAKEFIKNIYPKFSKWSKEFFYSIKILVVNLKTYQIYIFVSALCLAIALFVVLIYIKVSSFSILAADDFVHYSMGKLGYYYFKDVNIWEEGKNISNAIKYGIYDCLHLGGRYFAMFLQIALGPQNGVNILEKSKTVMQGINILYFVSLFLASISVGRLVIKENKIKSFLFSSLLYLSFLVLYHAFHYNAENFTWFSASVSYVVPFSFFLLSLYIFLKEKISIVEAILLFIFIICAQGGNISVSVLNLLLVVMFCFVLSVNDRCDTVHFAFIFHYIVFGLISILAPGNFNRRTASGLDKNINMVEGFNWARKIVFSRMDKIFTNELIWVFFLIFGIIIGIYIFKSIKALSQTYIVCSIFLLFLPYLMAFIQSFLGNILTEFERTKMTIDMFIVINTLNIITIVVYAILAILSHIVKNNYEVVLLACLIVFVSRGLYNKEKPVTFEKISIVEMVEDLYNETYDKYYNDYARIINTMEKNSGKEYVVIEKIKNKKPKNLNPYVYMPNIEESEGAFFDIKNIVFR